jgi:singapore isolate B (sub-type 7) whole genome shotgun sequence assembly, scaffold_2
VQGNNISPGYFRHPELTKEAYDADNFFHTGDIAMVFPNGATKVRENGGGDA